MYVCIYIYIYIYILYTYNKKVKQIKIYYIHFGEPIFPKNLFLG